jgi:hypothetical protein
VKSSIVISLLLLALLACLAPVSPLEAGSGSSVLNGVYPFAGAFIVGRNEPVVAFHDKDRYTMVGFSLVDDLSPSWGFEASFAIVPDKNDSTYLLYYGNMITNLRITELIYPYLTVGAGAYTVADPGDAETNLALNEGIGLKIRLSSSTHIRVDYRDFMFFLGGNDVQHFQHLVFGVGYAFDSVLFEW